MMGKIIFNISFFCWKRGEKMYLGYCEEFECKFFKGLFFNNEQGESGLFCDLTDIERECKNCLYVHNQRDDNTCGRCGGNQSNWSPNKIILCT